MHTLLTRGYTPGINSADMYFHQCEVDQYRIRAIGVADVPDKQIMVGAQIAFRKAVDTTVMQIIDNGWAIAKASLKYAPTSTVFRAFKTHYSKHLRENYINTKTNGKRQQAHAVEALTATIEQLQTKVDNNAAEVARNAHQVHTIANTQDQMLAHPEAYSTHYVPSVVSATTATTPSGLANSALQYGGEFTELKGTVESLAQQIQALTRLQQQGPTHTGAPPNRNQRNSSRRPMGDPNGPWRQWKYWRYTCGTNLSHNSPECHKTHRQKPSHHQYKDTATKDNPQGGNSSKDRLWMKWCHPATYEPHDTQGGE